MREILIVIGLFVMAMALRSSRTNLSRKLGALVFLGASFCFFYFISGNVFLGLAGACLWFFLPWIELLTHVRRLRMPLNNRLRHRDLPNPSFFPNAIEAATGMEEAGFEHFLVTDYSAPRIRPAHAVRVIIPGIETTNPLFTGTRARATLIRDLLPRRGG